MHEQGKGIFRIVSQFKIKFKVDQYRHIYSECSNEKGNWFSEISDKKNSNEVIEAIEKELENKKKSENKNLFHQAFAWPFLIRKALIENGYPVEGVANFPAVW